MEEFTKILLKVGTVVIIAIPLLLAFHIGQQRGKRKAQEGLKPQIDTIYRTDTIRLSKPTFSTSRIISSIPVPVALPVTVREQRTDTVYVSLPREERVYQDSSYRAVISGYRPSLDTIDVYQRTVTVDRLQVVKARTHWGLGITAGYGAVINNQQIYTAPFIGIGVSYNIATW